MGEIFELSKTVEKDDTIVETVVDEMVETVVDEMVETVVDEMVDDFFKTGRVEREVE